MPTALLFLAGILAAAEPPVKVVMLGDSITRGVRPGVKVEETFAVLLQQGLRKQGIEAEVINAGIGGERTDLALKRLTRDVLARKPAVVAVMYGTNDSYVDAGKTESRLTPEQYRANLKQLVDELHKAGIQPVLMTSPRWGDAARRNGADEHPNLRLERYVAVCREVARETKTPLVDHFEHWSRQAKAGVKVGDWTTDQCHLNPEGHRVLTETMLPVILKVVRP